MLPNLRVESGDGMNKTWKLRTLYLSAVFAAGAVYLLFTGNNPKEKSTSVIVRNEISETKNDVPTVITAVSTQNETSAVAAQKTAAMTEAVSGTMPEIPQYIDINEADAETLSRLDGVGNVLAERIVRYRDENGGFDNIEQIMEVEGIGQAKFDLIKERIFVADPVYYDENEDEPPIYDVPDEVTEHIPTLEETAPIDLNTADKELLMLLPNVDDEAADAIISLREKLGGFSNSYELLYIDELSQNDVAEILEFVTIGQ